MSLTLYGTPRSHFTRIVRVLCRELELEPTWVDVGNVGSAEPFAGSPLMQVPVLTDEERTVWDSHEICRYLVERQGADPLGVLETNWEQRNLLSVIRGVMSAEVRLILAERGGLEPVGPYFDKARETIRGGLRWIDGRIEAQAGLTYPAVCAVCMWDHVVLYENARPEDAPRLARFVESLGERESVVSTQPTRPVLNPGRAAPV